MAERRTDAGQIAAELQPARKKAPARTLAVTAQTVEIGASGTENLFGTITGAEYLQLLRPPEGFRVYEEMRSSSAQVQASLQIVKAPILSSTPTIRAAKNADPVDRGIAEFCQAALFGPQAMRLPWRLAFEHLLTRLDFGVAVLEKVWRYDREAGTFRIDKLAPRLATTLAPDAWHLWGTSQSTEYAKGKTLTPGRAGELAFIVQQGIRPDGTWARTPMPASKCVVSTYRREGDNFWGRSLLRPAYFHWFAMMELLRISLVRADRFGVGIPKAKITSDEAWLDKKLLAQVKRALKALRSHERAYLLEHPSVTFSIEGPGAMTNGSGVSLKEDIDLHASMIIQNVLASFMNSKADGLSTNRTRSLADIFSAVLELVAGDVAEDLTEQVVRELCDLNFVMEGRPYPEVAFTNIADTDLDSLVNGYTGLVAVGGLTPTVEDEQHFREMYKLPALPEGVRENPVAGDDEPDDPQLPDPHAIDPDDAEDDGEDDESERSKVAARAKGSAEQLLARQPTELEVVLLRQPESLARALNQTSDGLERRLAAVRKVQLNMLVKQIVARDARATTSAFTDLRPEHFNIPAKALTLKAIREIQKRVFADGRRRVRQELARQGGGVELRATTDSEEWRVVALAAKKKKKPQPSVPDSAAAAASALTSSARVTAERLNDAWFARVLEVAARLRRGGITGPDLATDVFSFLEKELSAGLRGTAKAEVNEAFGLGRAVEARVQKDEIDTVVYSCLLDVNSCAPCEALDGEEFAFGSERYLETLPPYKGCEGNKGGGDACRCMHLFLMKGRTV